MVLTGDFYFQGFTMNLRPLVKIPSVSLSMKTKITVISVTVGITLLGFLARALRRRRGKPPKPSERINPFSGRRAKAIQNWSVTNGEATQFRSTSSSAYRPSRRGSFGSDRHSVHSVLTASVKSAAPPAATVLTPQQLGTMGMEALETAIAYWEDALSAYRPPPGEMLALTDAEEGKFTHVLEKILDESYKLQEFCSHLFLNESSVLFKMETQSVTSSRQERHSESDRRTMTTMSSVDSFVSAQDEVADLQDFEEFSELNIDLKELALYQTALKKYEEGLIPIRLLRTEMLRCQTNMEYVSKVYCVRGAFQFLFEKEHVHTWFFEIGRTVLAGLMLHGGKDPRECLLAYRNIIEYSKNTKNWPIMEEELKTRDVKCLSFFDVVLDFIVLDAFEDLSAPPSSVLSVVQNRWLSDAFKETALATAIWSIMKAKRHMLKFQDGFISRFYSVSEYIIPVLAWGFLGSNEKFKDLCITFKEEVMSFILDIFDFNKVRYSKVEDLASDIMELAKSRFGRICDKLKL